MLDNHLTRSRDLINLQMLQANRASMQDSKTVARRLNFADFTQKCFIRKVSRKVMRNCAPPKDEPVYGKGRPLVALDTIPS